MALKVRTVEYFYTRLEGEPAKAYEFLEKLASEEINLLAFSAVPYGPNRMELTIFPERTELLVQRAKELGWVLTGPYHACLIQGDDQLGALAQIQKTLIDAGVSIYASSGVTDGVGRYGYVIYLKEGDHANAAKVLGG